MQSLPPHLDTGERLMARRSLPWSLVRSAIQADRDVRPSIREERLQVAGVEHRAKLTLSSWRGHSGRRYVVIVHPFSAGDLVLARDSTLIAVRREPSGTAAIVGMFAMRDHPRDFALGRFLERADESLATEIHIHRLAESEAARDAVIQDLST